MKFENKGKKNLELKSVKISWKHLCPELQVSVTKCPLILFTLLFVLARNTDNKQRHKVLDVGPNKVNKDLDITDPL